MCLSLGPLSTSLNIWKTTDLPSIFFTSPDVSLFGTTTGWLTTEEVPVFLDDVVVLVVDTVEVVDVVEPVDTTDDALDTTSEEVTADDVLSDEVTSDDDASDDEETEAVEELDGVVDCFTHDANETVSNEAATNTANVFLMLIIDT
jgi:hypothetical protein